MMSHLRAKTGQTGAQNETLRHSIHELASAGIPSYGNVIEIGGKVDRALALTFTEINQTVLPRLIVIDCHPVGKLLLQVSHRRLIECRFTDKEVCSTSHSDGDIQTLARKFVALLADVFSHSQNITFEAPVATNGRADTSMSCSAELLWEISELEGSPDATSDGSVSYISRIKSVASAWRICLTSCEEIEVNGSQDDTNLLDCLADALSSENQAVDQTQFVKGGETFFFCPLGSDAFFVTAQDSRSEIVALVSHENIEELAPALATENSGLPSPSKSSLTP